MISSFLLACTKVPHRNKTFRRYFRAKSLSVGAALGLPYPRKFQLMKLIAPSSPDFHDLSIKIGYLMLMQQLLHLLCHIEPSLCCHQFKLDYDFYFVHELYIPCLLPCSYHHKIVSCQIPQYPSLLQLPHLIVPPLLNALQLLAHN